MRFVNMEVTDQFTWYVVLWFPGGLGMALPFYGIEFLSIPRAACKNFVHYKHIFLTGLG